MPLPRFFPDPVLNNVALTAAATAILLLAPLALTIFLRWVVRQATQSVRSKSVESAAEQVQKSLRLVATVLALLVVVGGCATLAIAIIRDIDLHPWANRFVAYASVRTGQDLLHGATIVVAVAVGWLALRIFFKSLVDRIQAKLLSVAALEGQKEEIPVLRQRATSLGSVAFLYGLHRLGSESLGLPWSVHWLLDTILYVLLVVCAARTLAGIGVLSLEGIDNVGAARLEKSALHVYYAGIRKLLPLAKRTLEAIIHLAAATLIVRQFQTLEAFAPYGPRIIRLLGTFFAARVFVELARVVLVEAFAGEKSAEDETSKHRVTLVYLLQSIVTYVIYFGSALIMMDQLGIDTKPFLAGAGIVGLAVGLGAQKLVNDMVSGFFILFEGHLLKGDYVRIGDCEGTIDSVQLRVTMIRDGFGRMFTFRNGDIGTIINFSREYVHAVVDVVVELQANLNQVFEALVEAGRRLGEAHPDRVLDKLVVRGVTQIAQNGIVVRVAVKLTPGDPDPMPRILRKFIKEVFDERGIQLANATQLAVVLTNDAAEAGRALGKPRRAGIEFEALPPAP
ncbi:mechanosensitive ion channel family protein [Polyangium sorediatum]|uniref:Mechanosensitive ion channel family protein n=1 Tax=Polyangium sorediatum TaxID=889274 RepID=A0ABT6P5Z3_9BACT|nr:mechanosensitive ion channel family protein [Polyangium sorediatum]MDI1436024.1 mechanosensitive ion channel family protein [Polyangium sorediatum]